MPELGFAIRFMRQFDPAEEREHSLRLWALVLNDDRDVPLPQKVNDADTFLRRQVH